MPTSLTPAIRPSLLQQGGKGSGESGQVENEPPDVRELTKEAFKLLDYSMGLHGSYSLCLPNVEVQIFGP